MFCYHWKDFLKHTLLSPGCCLGIIVQNWPYRTPTSTVLCPVCSRVTTASISLHGLYFYLIPKSASCPFKGIKVNTISYSSDLVKSWRTLSFFVYFSCYKSIASSFTDRSWNRLDGQKPQQDQGDCACRHIVT